MSNNGLSFREQLTAHWKWIAVLVATLASGGLAILSVNGDPLSAAVGFWGAMAIVSGALLVTFVSVALWAAAPGGPLGSDLRSRQSDLRSHQIAAFTMALVVSTLVAHDAAADLVRSVAAVGHALFIDTPEAVSGDCGGNAGGVRMASILRSMTEGTPPVCESNPGVAKEKGAGRSSRRSNCQQWRLDHGPGLHRGPRQLGLVFPYLFRLHPSVPDSGRSAESVSKSSVGPRAQSR